MVPIASRRRNSLRWVLEGLTHRGPHLGRPRPLTAHQRDEALHRLAQGETQARSPSPSEALGAPPSGHAPRSNHPRCLFATLARVGRARCIQHAAGNEIGPRELIHMDFERYWKRVEAAPMGVALRVLVTNRSGDHYVLPYPCSLTAAGWVNAATGISLALRPTHWQLYVETLPNKRAWVRRSPARRIGSGGVSAVFIGLPDICTGRHPAPNSWRSDGTPFSQHFNFSASEKASA